MLKAIAMVFIGGGLGSVIRYLIGRSVVHYFPSSFPTATLISNLIACLILGLVAYLTVSKTSNLSPAMVLLLATGFCGGLSTFSTFSFESLELIRQGMYTYAIMNILFSLAMGMLSIYFLISKMPNHESL